MTKAMIAQCYIQRPVKNVFGHKQRPLLVQFLSETTTHLCYILDINNDHCSRLSLYFDNDENWDEN